MESLHGIDLDRATLKTFINKSGNRIMIIYPEEIVLQEEFRKSFETRHRYGDLVWREVSTQTIDLPGIA
jgi:hypothetical protein